MTGEEIELKWALDVAGHAELARRLPALLGTGEDLAQENRYCDSSDGRLRAAGLALRLRRENARLVMTCKAKRGLPGADGLHHHQEIECDLDPAWWTKAGEPSSLPLPLPPAWITALAGAPLITLGGFANHRMQFHDGIHLLCLDRTDFGSRVDHELEIETPDPAAAHGRWSALLASWHVAWTPQMLTKLHRYLALRR